MVVCYVSKNYLTEIFHIQEKSSKFCLKKCKQNLPDLCSDFSHGSWPMPWFGAILAGEQKKCIL